MKIVFTNDVEIVDEEHIILDKVNTISVSENGRLLYNSEDIYGDDFYINNKSISLNISKYGTDTISVYVYVWQGSEQTYSIGSVIKLLNYEFSS